MGVGIRYYGAQILEISILISISTYEIDMLRVRDD